METPKISPETWKLAFSKGFISEEKGWTFFREGHAIHTHTEYGISGKEDTFKEASQYELQDWIREEHRIDVDVYSNASGYLWQLNKAFRPDSFSDGIFISDSGYSGPNDAGAWNSHIEAREAGLTAALNLINNKK